jgi:hypothetical protein
MVMTISPPARRSAGVPAPRRIRRRAGRVHAASGVAFLGIYALAVTGGVSTGALTWAAWSTVAVLAAAAALGAARRNRQWPATRR